ncbi:MAG TPA: zinc-binding alcohol dehydrogenase family protein [Solirubrobacteraceae bacterium]|nr:zinc-binding alcohol dehydrogenase family protein [Solirubrobacteraceae bacterium]
MNAAVLHEHGATPRYGPFEDPEPGDGAVVLEVAAAGLHHLDLLKASGRFYMDPPPLPSAVGTDGVGRLEDGRRVYFDETVAPFGSMAERALARDTALFDMDEGIDDVTAAALGNTGLGAWLAVTERSGLERGDTLLVLGCGAFGTLAVQIARLHGAGRIVAADRGGDRLERLRERGADAVVALDEEDDLPAAFRAAAEGDLDVTIDTLWGEPATAAIQAAARHARHLQVGHIAGLEITLPATALRSVSLDLRGFRVDHPPPEVRRKGFLALTRHVAQGDIAVDLEAIPLEQVETAWERQCRAEGGAKLVLVP